MSNWQRLGDEPEVTGRVHAREAGWSYTSCTERMEVPGGWIYRTIVSGSAACTAALCFVPASGGGAAPKRVSRTGS